MHEYTLVVSNRMISFHDHSSLEDFLRKLVKEFCYSNKTSMSVFVEADGDLVDQFVGEIWHYVDDLCEEVA